MTVLQKPIVLWNTKRHTSHVTDDAGISIKKSLLPPPVRTPKYNVHEPTFTGAVPPLAYFCIKALASFPDQLHTLAHFRLSYRDDLACALLPLRPQPDDQIHQGSNTPHFDTTALDPRLWVTFAQVMHPLPEQLHDLDLPLGDIHLPLLQQMLNTPNFSLLTLLSLPNCKDVSDDTIGELRRLNSLAALDLRGTNITAYALTVLARGLSWTDDDDLASRRRTGLWGLRILSLHNCTSIDDKVVSVLPKFPLLSAVGKKNLFHPAPLSLALYTLDNLAITASTPIPLYSCPSNSVFRLHIDELYYPVSHQEATLPVWRAKTGTTIAPRRQPSAAQDLESLESQVPIYTVRSPSLSSLGRSSRDSERDDHPLWSLPTGMHWKPDVQETWDDSTPVRRLSRRFRPEDGTTYGMGGIEWKQPNNGHTGEGAFFHHDSDHYWTSEKGSEAWDEERDGGSDEEADPYGVVYDSEILHGFPSSHRATSIALTETVPLSMPHLSRSTPMSHIPLHSLSRQTSFYHNADVRSRRSKCNILPLLAQTVQSSEDGQLDPLAVARLPPPWSTLDTYTPPSPTIYDSRNLSIHHSVSPSEHRCKKSRQREPVFGWTDTTLNDPARLDRACLNKRGSGAFADTVNKLAGKQLEVASEFALANAQARMPAKLKLRNPFAKNAKSVFADSNLTICGPVEPPFLGHQSPTKAEPKVLRQARGSFLSTTTGRVDEMDAETSSKPLKPITALKPPVLPKEFLPLPPKQPMPASKLQANLKQARLSFTRPEP
ncbi:hypothetical protein BS17DRAFT_813810 [Gyrodon lividus]|nr:hypothetical protein BS17DRAFT_813810 [Gyrodon lividus]